jgi:hypothetical protein
MVRTVSAALAAAAFMAATPFVARAQQAEQRDATPSPAPAPQAAQPQKRSGSYPYRQLSPDSISIKPEKEKAKIDRLRKKVAKEKNIPISPDIRADDRDRDEPQDQPWETEFMVDNYDPSRPTVTTAARGRDFR